MIVVAVVAEDGVVVAAVAAAAEDEVIAEDGQTETCQDAHHDFQFAGEALQSHLRSASFGSVECAQAPTNFAESCSFQRFAGSSCVQNHLSVIYRHTIPELIGQIHLVSNPTFPRHGFVAQVPWDDDYRQTFFLKGNKQRTFATVSCHLRGRMCAFF